VIRGGLGLIARRLTAGDHGTAALGRGVVSGHGEEGWGHGRVRNEPARLLVLSGEHGEARGHGYDDGGGGRSTVLTGLGF